MLPFDWNLKGDSKFHEETSVVRKKFDIVCLFNVLDRAGAPVTLLEDALSMLKDDGLIMISVSVPWRPSPTGSNKVTSGPALIKTKYTGITKQRKERLVDVPHVNKNRTYPWYSPIEIPKKFEMAAQGRSYNKKLDFR